jgi:hypothetical protein
MMFNSNSLIAMHIKLLFSVLLGSAFTNFVSIISTQDEVSTAILNFGVTQSST